MKNTIRLLALDANLVWSQSTAWWWNSSPSDYTKTRYPIVLVHGMFGFDTAAGIDYWYRIPSDLRSEGGTVCVASVPALNSTVARGRSSFSRLKKLPRPTVRST